MFIGLNMVKEIQKINMPKIEIPNRLLKPNWRIMHKNQIGLPLILKLDIRLNPLKYNKNKLNWIG